MAAITDLSALINRMTGGNSGLPDNQWFHKLGRYDGAVLAAFPVIGRPWSLWRLDGQPGPGAVPTTWANPDNTTAGGLKQFDPTGGRQKWLTQFFCSVNNSGTLLLYDRLGHNGNLDGTVITPQTFTGSLTRYTDGIGNMMWYETYGNTSIILGSTATTLTVGYDAPEGTGFTSPTVVVGGSGYREGMQARFVPLISGHTGVKQVTNVDLLASTGTAGAFGITVAHPLAYVSIVQAAGAGWRDFTTGLPGLPEIKTDACLSFLWIAGSGTITDFYGCVSMVEA